MSRLAGWLKKRGYRNSAKMAEKALPWSSGWPNNSALLTQRSLTSMLRSPICSGSTTAPIFCSPCRGSDLRVGRCGLTDGLGVLYQWTDLAGHRAGSSSYPVLESLIGPAARQATETPA